MMFLCHTGQVWKCLSRLRPNGACFSAAAVDPLSGTVVVEEKIGGHEREIFFLSLMKLQGEEWKIAVKSMDDD